MLEIPNIPDLIIKQVLVYVRPCIQVQLNSLVENLGSASVPGVSMAGLLTPAV